MSLPGTTKFRATNLLPLPERQQMTFPAVLHWSGPL